MGNSYRDQYGVLAGNPALDKFIYQCFDLLPSSVVHKLAKRLKHQHENVHNAAMHTTREILFGAHLVRHGEIVAYDQRIYDKTPDWTIGPDATDPTALIDAVTFSPGANGPRENVKRLFATIDEKAGKYAAVAREHRKPFVVAVFSEILSCVDEIDQEDALELAFADRPTLSGVVFGEDRGAVSRSATFGHLAQ